MSVLHAMVLACAPLAALAGPPESRVEAVVDTYHGQQVTDPYRWLEDGDSPEVRAWTRAQNEHARAHLDRLAGAEAIRARVREIETATSSAYFSPHEAGGRLFAMKRQPPRQQPFLVVMPSPDQPDQERILVDPGAIDAEGTTAIDWFVPSPDGRLVAVSMSHAGTESGDVHVIDVATGARTGEIIERVNGGTAGGDLDWTPDGSGFYYTRYPREGERPPEDLDFFQQVSFHRLGTPHASDRYELGEGLPRIAEIQMEVDQASGRVLATVQDGDGGEFAHFLRETSGSWRQLTRFSSRIPQVAFAPDDSLLVVSREGAPRGKIVRVGVDGIADSVITGGVVVVPESEAAIVTSFMDAPSLVASRDWFIVTDQLGGPSRLRVFGLDGSSRRAPEVLPVSSVSSPTPLADGTVLFYNASFIDPPAWYRFDPGTGRTRRTALAMASPVDFSDAEVVREWATSADGTKVPINIIRPKGLELTGDVPVILTGYGGYGISLEPRFRPLVRLWLEQGGVYAVANVRGGGEFGKAWHEQGRLAHKQNVFDDFSACIEHMFDAGYTNPARMAITGGSNGGLLMGAVLTQRPELARAVVSFVGIYDMLRVELSPNGSFNVPEFGTVTDPALYAAMRAYSPYHNVRDGTRYPSVLLITGENDPRVDPMQSRKFAARLQAASRGGPVLLRTSAGAGHGGDNSLTERIEQAVDMYAFLFHELGIQYKPVAGGAQPPKPAGATEAGS
jgi:prolyl oligopeptidase